MGEITIRAVRPHWAGIRDIIALERFRGASVDAFESSGWLVRTFTIKGDDAALSRIWRVVDAHQKAAQAG